MDFLFLKSKRIVFAMLYFIGALGCLGESAQSLAHEGYSDINSIVRQPLAANSVLIFYWHDCPICNSYAPEINRLAAAHTNFNFYIIHIDPDLTVAAAKKHAKDFDLHPPVLLDPRHELVKMLKAKVTPEAVVLGKNGAVWYRGRIDDLYAALGKRRSQAKSHDLSDALVAITAGKSVSKSKTKAIGCLIQPIKN